MGKKKNHTQESWLGCVGGSVQGQERGWMILVGPSCSGHPVILWKAHRAGGKVPVSQTLSCPAGLHSLVLRTTLCVSQKAFCSSLCGDGRAEPAMGCLSTCSDAAPLGPSGDDKGEQGEGWRG